MTEDELSACRVAIVALEAAEINLRAELDDVTTALNHLRPIVERRVKLRDALDAEYGRDHREATSHEYGKVH